MPECFVAKAADLKDGDRRIVVSGQHEVGVFFKDGAYYAYSNYCVHAGGPACEGILVNNVRGRAQRRQDLRGADLRRQRAFRLPLARLRIRPQDRRVRRRPQAQAAQVQRGEARRRHLRRDLKNKTRTHAHGHAAKRSPPAQPRAVLTETKALEHASQQARQRNYQDFLIVDVDAHHYESEVLQGRVQLHREPGHQDGGAWTRCRAPAVPASSTARSATRTSAAA